MVRNARAIRKWHRPAVLAMLIECAARRAPMTSQGCRGAADHCPPAPQTRISPGTSRRDCIRLQLGPRQRRVWAERTSTAIEQDNDSSGGALGPVLCPHNRLARLRAICKAVAVPVTDGPDECSWCKWVECGGEGQGNRAVFARRRVECRQWPPMVGPRASVIHDPRQWNGSSGSSPPNVHTPAPSAAPPGWCPPLVQNRLHLSRGERIALGSGAAVRRARGRVSAGRLHRPTADQSAGGW